MTKELLSVPYSTQRVQVVNVEDHWNSRQFDSVDTGHTSAEKCLEVVLIHTGISRLTPLLRTCSSLLLYVHETCRRGLDYAPYLESNDSTLNQKRPNCDAKSDRTPKQI